MSGSSRVLAPYRRSGRASALKRAGEASPARLASLAGRTSIDRLEPRQLLFSLTITPDNIGPDGLGTVSQAFAYTVPYIGTSVDIGDNDPADKTEDFAEIIPGNVGGNVEIDDSFLRIRHNVQPGRDVRIVADTGPDGPIAGTERMVTRLSTGEFLSFEWDSGDDVLVDNVDLPMIQFSMEIERQQGTFGLDYNNLQVVLELQGQVVATLTGTTLRDMNTAPAADNGLIEGRGQFTFNRNNPAIGSPFDRVRIEGISGPSDEFQIDNLNALIAPGNFADIVDSTIFGGFLVFRGPVGATVQVLDLYGRDMRSTFSLGKPEGLTNLTLVDIDDDGVPNFNDGIGRIVMSNVDSRASLTLLGATVEAGEAQNALGDPGVFQEGVGDNAFTLTVMEEIGGLFDELESAGFGYEYDAGDDVASGLPPAGGSIVVGSPIVRDNSSPEAYNAGGQFATSITDVESFNRIDQGVFINDGSAMGRVMIHGVVHGSSQFSGAVNEIIYGYSVGSVTVAGDLGLFVSGSDAGVWVSDPGFVNPVGVTKTGGELFVGRTLGEMSVGGRLFMDVTVLGDLTSPTTRPPRDILRYTEKEWIIPFSEDAQIDEADVISTLVLLPMDLQPILFGTQFYRNDDFLNAEWIGSIGTSVEISGQLGFGDPILQTAEDPADVFAFASDGVTPIIIQNDLVGGLLIRVMDEQGRTLVSLDELGDAQDAESLRFQPKSPGVYYLVVSGPDDVDGDFDAGVFYRLSITGMAPTTVGAIRSGGGLGSSDDGVGPTISILSGSLGSLRVGTGFIVGDGTVTSGSTVANTEDDDDDFMRFGSATISVPGDLFNVITGSDIQGTSGASPARLLVGGNFGTLQTGLSPISGVASTEGDVAEMILSVGGSIAMLDIKGAIGIDQDDPALPFDVSGLQIVTGTNPSLGQGNIGMIRVGSHIAGGRLRIQTPDNSIIGGLFVSQDSDNTIGSDIGIYNGGIFTSQMLKTGLNSDVRFVDFPSIDINGVQNAQLQLFAGSSVELTDDAGGKLRISISGVASATAIGAIRFIPVNESEGVAIASIQANLSGGRILTITSVGEGGENDPISIGRIVVTDATNTSEVRIGGDLEVDVYRIIQTGGIAFNEIINNTPGGDIVAIDVIGLNTLTISHGNLGRTQVPAWGPQLIGPELGVESGLSEEVGSALGINPAAIDPTWGGTLFRGVNDTNTAFGTASLDDIGGPFDGFLDGMVIRTGSLVDATIAGSVGDLILQDAAGVLINLTVNSDDITAPGGFDGIVGSIYAQIINRIEIGDGLAADDQSPVASSGIFAADEIRTITGGDSPGAFISGLIMAANVVGGQPTEFGGIDSITLDGGGDFVDATIEVGLLDNFWLSPFYTELNVQTGDINNIQGDGADLFRSVINAININTIRLRDGFFDASQVSAINDIGTISATGYRNSTATGSNIEFHRNEIRAGGDVNDIETELSTGTISDLTIDILGRITGAVTADVLSRVDLDVDNEIEKLDITTAIRGSSITTGRLTDVFVGGTIAATEFNVAGPIISLIAGDRIVNTNINITGPDGRIDLIQADTLISGSIASAGPIGTIMTLSGDIVLSIRTLSERGGINLLSAARDLILDTDISAGVNQLIAGRHLGSQDNPNVILIRGDLASVSLPGGQLYSDLRVGGTVGVNKVVIDGVSGGGGGPLGITIGRATHTAASDTLGRGSIIAFGRIGPVVINGDFGGSIESSSNGIESITINNGSLLPGSRIAAYDGDVESVIINAGHLLGDIYADYDIVSLIVNPSANGIFGDIGINPALSASAGVDGFRNQLPLGVTITDARDGPSIMAGHNIVAVSVPGGTVFESQFHAGRDIISIIISGRIRGDGITGGTSTFITAGDTIHSLVVATAINDALIGAGLFDLGADNLPGGVGLDADVVRSGSVLGVTTGISARTIITAGMNAGNDGIYATGNEITALGRSVVSGVVLGSLVTDVTVSADVIDASVKADGRINTIGENRPNAEPGVIPTSEVRGKKISASGRVFNHLGVSGTMFFTGPGEAFWNGAQGRVILTGTTLASSLTIVTNNAAKLNNFDIVSTDDSAIGVLVVSAELTGDSSITIDEGATTVTLAKVNTTGSINFGGDVGTMTIAELVGFVTARAAGRVDITGDFGASNPGIRGEARIDLLASGPIDIGGNNRGTVNVERNLTSLAVAGVFDTALVRVGGDLGVQSAGSGGGSVALSGTELIRTRISVRDAAGPIDIFGRIFDSAIMIGGDLGSDADFGGIGINADEATTGFGSSITGGGSFFESDIIAGALRGPDGFFGTPDDAVADGRSELGQITIADLGVGSNRFTESYEIFSTGPIAGVLIGGFEGFDQGNFSIVRADTVPAPIQVDRIEVSQASRLYTARIFFNQPIDASTVPGALSIREVRGEVGNIEIFLIEGIDYTISYDEATNAAVIAFDRDITNRDLPRLAGVPGPGVYRFVLDGNILRAQLGGARLDGNGDGFARADDQFSRDDIVGDAGDKFVDSTVQAGSGFQAVSIDFYSPINLDVVLDDNFAPDGLPDANTIFTIRGSIGDHPDNETNFFGFAGDMDLFNLTLQAGQILRLGPPQGSALFTPVSVLTPSGELVTGIFGGGSSLTALPVNTSDQFDLTIETSYLIRQTGTYTIIVGNAAAATANPNTIPNPPSAPGTVGDYRFTLEIFDDGNSGFSDVTDAGNGDVVVNAPPASDFTGPDGVLGTADDFDTVVVGDFSFTLSAGADGVLGTADDLVSGENSSGITSTRVGSRLVSTINSAIGPVGHAGVPGDVFSDVDVFHLNNGRTIAPGTLMRITVKLAEVGGDLGSRGGDLGRNNAASFQDFTGVVQFALFDTTDSSSLDDATLVFAPTDFSPNGGVTGVLATNNDNSFGFDDNGDFFIQFAAPGRIGTTGTDPASYAIYLQGAFNTDYTIEVVTDGSGSLAKRIQNIFIETNGGTIDWLQAGSRTTDLGRFDPRVLGLTGTTSNGTPLKQFVLEELIANLQGIYDDAGLDVRFSTNPADFEFQAFSTVFLTSSPDPISQFFSTFDFFDFFGATFITQPFGFSQHADALNIDDSDEAVIFVPSFGRLGYTPSPTDVDNLVDSLTGAIGRHVGELLGLRVTTSNGIASSLLDIQGADAVENIPDDDSSFTISTLDRALSDPFDQVESTDFWLGTQNARSLLDKILAN